MVKVNIVSNRREEQRLAKTYNILNESICVPPSYLIATVMVGLTWNLNYTNNICYRRKLDN